MAEDRFTFEFTNEVVLGEVIEKLSRVSDPALLDDLDVDADAKTLSGPVKFRVQLYHWIRTELPLVIFRPNPGEDFTEPKANKTTALVVHSGPKGPWESGFKDLKQHLAEIAADAKEGMNYKRIMDQEILPMKVIREMSLRKRADSQFAEYLEKKSLEKMRIIGTETGRYPTKDDKRGVRNEAIQQREANIKIIMEYLPDEQSINRLKRKLGSIAEENKKEGK